MCPTCASARASSTSRSSIVERRVARYERLAPSGAIAQIQLEEAKLELEGLKDRRVALDKVRREPEALIAPGQRRDRRGHAGRRADRAAQRGGVPDHRSGAALGRGAELRPRCRSRASAIATTTNGRTLAARVPRLGPCRPQPVDPGAIRDRWRRRRACAPASSSPCSLKTGEEKKGIAIPRAQRDPRARMGRTSSTSTPRAERFEARAVRVEPLDGERVLVAAGIDPGQRDRRPGRRTARSRAVRAAPCSRSSSPRSLRNRLLVLALSLVLVVFGSFSMLRLPVDVLPDLNRADRHHHDRGGGAGAARGRAAGQLPDRDADERRAGRDARALGVGRRPVDRLCRVRLGHRHLPQPPARRRAARPGARSAAAERRCRTWGRSARSWARS